MKNATSQLFPELFTSFCFVIRLDFLFLQIGSHWVGRGHMCGYFLR